MACRLLGAKSLPEPMLTYLTPEDKFQWNLNQNSFPFTKMHLKMSPANLAAILSRPHFYQTRSAWSKDQGSNENHSPVHNFAPTVTKLCVMWEGQALPHDTKFGNCRDKIVDKIVFHSWSLILGSSWSGLIKLGPGGDELAEIKPWISKYMHCFL